MKNLAQCPSCDRQLIFKLVFKHEKLQKTQLTKAPFTLRSIFGTARIKLVPVPLFWFLDYLFS
jgi:hypothetical protein